MWELDSSITQIIDASPDTLQKSPRRLHFPILWWYIDVTVRNIRNRAQAAISPYVECVDKFRNGNHSGPGSNRMAIEGSVFPVDQNPNVPSGHSVCSRSTALPILWRYMDISDGTVHMEGRPSDAMSSDVEPVCQFKNADYGNLPDHLSLELKCPLWLPLSITQFNGS